MTDYYVYGLFYKDQKGFDRCFYIGSGKGNRKERHFKDWEQCNPYKQNKIEKLKRCGRQPFSKIIYDNLAEDRARELEQLFLDDPWIFEKLTNISQKAKGGAGSGKDHPLFGVTGKDHPAYGRTGEHNPFYGRQHSRKSREAISNSLKGRSDISENQRGEKNSNGKLTQDEASEIKWLALNSDIKQSDIGKRYNVRASAVSQIKNGKRWKRVSPQKPNI